MSEILLHYKRPDPITWVYLSSFLTFGLYFAFHRFWSMRNLDLVLLVLLAPGLLIVQEARRQKLITIKTEVAEKRLISTASLSPSIDTLETESEATKPKVTNGSDAGPSLLQPDTNAPSNNKSAILDDSPPASVAGIAKPRTRTSRVKTRHRKSRAVPKSPRPEIWNSTDSSGSWRCKR